ncbi:dTMP kinase [Borrelia sp. RT1S]|uniref:dTMP kinase n=1 Tax=Borrelia sp. RT1S TaxID=2898580 RepID=UPI001E33F754|nr:dTMP kinase [Borrelia sp. RT1S]UGQ17906.1 dTMP kinase [Borrelia sp. RT1S]
MNRCRLLSNFYVLEGVDGVGKSSIIDAIKDLCVGNNKFNYHFTKEPTEGPIGTLIREELGRETPLFSNKTIEYLLFADREDHIYGKGGVASLLLNTPPCSGHKVICDRYLLSSVVYQGNPASLLDSPFPLPEVIFFINSSIDRIMSRLNKRSKSGMLDRVELDRDSIIKIRDRYADVINRINFSHLRTKLVVLENNVPNDIKSNAKEIIKAISNQGYLDYLVKQTPCKLA